MIFLRRILSATGRLSRRTRLIACCAIGLAGLTGVLAVIAADQYIAYSTSSRLYTSADALPAGEGGAPDVALVLGCSPTSGNLFFKHRMDAAAELYRSGKVRHLIVSGDNHVKTYDEPTGMRDALVSRGVPASAITLDYAGFRTLDSVVRARDVFGLNRVVIVTQDFHARRALFIADHHDIDAIALVAKDATQKQGVPVRIREVAARVRAVLDVCVLGKEPKFSGPPEPIRLAALTPAPPTATSPSVPAGSRRAPAPTP